MKRRKLSAFGDGADSRLALTRYPRTSRTPCARLANSRRDRKQAARDPPTVPAFAQVELEPLAPGPTTSSMSAHAQGSQTAFALWIINKAGGLIYSRTYADGLATLSSNDNLILASTFHSIHAIASRISPVPRSSGIHSIEADTFKMTCLQTPTGIKFVLSTTPSHPAPDAVLKRVYETYADYLKDPFYTIEMPIRSEVFEQKMQVAVRGF
jgi:hypothetical protein